MRYAHTKKTQKDMRMKNYTKKYAHPLLFFLYAHDIKKTHKKHAHNTIMRIMRIMRMMRIL